MENNGASQTPLETTPEQPSTPSPPPQLEVKKLSEHDILKVEHVGLKMQNLQLQEGMHKQELMRIMGEKARLQQELQDLRLDLAKRYDFDMEKVVLHPDGTIVPKPAGN